MNYYVFSKRRVQLDQEDTTWTIAGRFDRLGEAESFIEDHMDEVELEYQFVPAQTEEDAKAQLDMPNRPF